MVKIAVKPGKYVVAVSGGVDSVVLLDLLKQKTGLELVVAHFDHGIRKDSAKDREFVANLSQKYGLPFEYAEGDLGSEASEEQARQARYEFLRSVRKKYRAEAIITAHHQDDVIETMCLNLLRGTGRLGLTSLKSGEEIIRPLLKANKQQIKDYAAKHKLKWREDSTNTDEKYQRNWIRHKILNKLSIEQRKKFVELYEHASSSNEEMNALLSSLLGEHGPSLSKKLVINAPHDVAKEIVAHWLRDNKIRDFDKKTLERLVIGAKTLPVGKSIAVKSGKQAVVSKQELHLQDTAGKNTAHSV